ncbi:adenylyl-sulfate kinase [Desulfonatronum sp. SC1]
MLWFTGLPGSGNSTICLCCGGATACHGQAAPCFDGDNVR